MKKKICFKILGDIRVSTEDGKWRSVSDYQNMGAGKKQQAFLIYLILNHKNTISSVSLMEMFWSNERKNPANSLKNMVHKTRTLLQAMLPELENLLVTRPGGYEWNREIEIECDAELFEEYYHKAKLGLEEGTEWKKKAFDLYDGAVFTDPSFEWLSELSKYYQIVYLDICKELALELLEQQRWNEVIQVCSKAYKIAPEIEEFTLCLMQAMVNYGMHGQAIKHYENYSTMLWERFDRTPSQAVYQAYVLATHASQSLEMSLDTMIRQLSQRQETRQAFRCSLVVFQNIIQLELRHMARMKYDSSIVVFKVNSGSSDQSLSTDIRRVEQVLLDSLRAGDPFSRLDHGAFVLLLSGASMENAEKVVERVKNVFYSTYQRTNAIIDYRIYPLQVEVI